MGSNKRPFYRVVVADQRSPRDGRFIENIGKYHPLDDPSLIEIDAERALHWLRVGAQPSNQVRNLLRKLGIWETFVAERPSAERRVKPPKTDRPVREKVSKKQQAKAAEAETEEPEAAAPAEAPEPSPDAEAPVEATETPEPVAEAAPADEATADEATADDGAEEPDGP
jgi:small subunit ribosomal protein S16